MRYKEISEDKSFLRREIKEQRLARLRPLAISKGYILNGVGGSPEKTISILNEPSDDIFVLTGQNRHLLRAWLDDEDDNL